MSEEAINWSADSMLEVTIKQPDDFLKIRETLTRIGVASRKDKTYKYFGKSFVGHSFLLNPRQLLAERKNYSNKEAAEYIAVAS